MRMRFNTRCWQCGFENNGLVPLFTDEKVLPKNGNLIICQQCGEFAVFDDTFPDRIRKPTPSENFEITRDKNCMGLKLHWYMKVGRHKK